MARNPSTEKFRLWQDRFNQLLHSQLSVQEFCQSVGCSAPTFYYWKRKLAGQAPRSKAMPKRSTPANRPNLNQQAFLPVLIRTAPLPQAVVTLSNGIKIELQCDPIEALQFLLQDMRRAQ